MKKGSGIKAVLWMFVFAKRIFQFKLFMKSNIKYFNAIGSLKPIKYICKFVFFDACFLSDKKFSKQNLF
jgi:hypothetical protein